MRSDSELLILIFRSEQKDGPAYAVRCCKIRRDKILFENPMAQVVRFWPKIRRLDPSDSQIDKWHRSSINYKINPKSDSLGLRILKSINGIGLQSIKNLAEQRRPGTTAVRGTPAWYNSSTSYRQKYKYDKRSMR